MSAQGVSVVPDKIQSILDWETPKSVKDVRSFLGLVGYYRRFIEGFSKIAKPMADLLKKPDLLKKGKKFEWSNKAEENFQILKVKLTSAPVLTLPGTSKDFALCVNAGWTCGSL